MLNSRDSYYEQMMSSKMDAVGGASTPTLRYCIASTPRSGSTLLSRTLETTKSAGVPMEYLNPVFMGAWQRLNPARRTQVSSYLSELESRRTTVNGVFGLKAHWRQLELIALNNRAPLEKVVEETIGKYTKFITINRRDKLAQAISLFIANHTKVYHSDQLALRNNVNTPAFDSKAISAHIARLFAEEAEWQSYLKKAGAETIEVIYEDLVSDHVGTCRRVFEFLGIPAIEVPTAPTMKLGTPETDEFRRLYLQHLGA